MMVPLDSVFDGINARTVAAPIEAELGLRMSIASQGVLTPVLLRPMEPRGFALVTGEAAQIPVNGANALEVVCGHRRVRAARAAGLTEIPAEVRPMTDAEARAAQAAENIQRQDMHPADQWRAVRDMVETDRLTIAQAAGALGLDDRVTARMEMLGRLHPKMLRLVEIDMPTEHEIRKVVRAPLEMQDAIASKHLAELTGDEDDTVAWYQIGDACKLTRISRTVAIFDADAAGIVWDEDLFAEPGSRDQFTTTDVDTFMARQQDALESLVAQTMAARRKAEIVKLDRQGAVALPKDFDPVYSVTPETAKKNQTAFYAIAADGSVRSRVAEQKRVKKPGKAAKGDGEQPTEDGPGAWRDSGDDDGEDGTEASDSSDDDAELETAQETAPIGVTQAGSTMIANAKTEALRARLRQDDMDAHDLLSLIVLALCGRNVHIAGGNAYGFDDLAARLMVPGGMLAAATPEPEIREIAREALARVVCIGGPKTNIVHASGPPAEWIGAYVDAAELLPRFDTTTFLAETKGIELKRAAVSAGVKSATATVLRQTLKDNAPTWRPQAAAFGAPSPRPRDRDDG